VKSDRTIASHYDTLQYLFFRYRQSMPKIRITKAHYESLAALRHALRRFSHFSQAAARRAGLTPQQHQALLAIKGFPGRDYASITELAERLQLQHHSVVGLVDRLARRRLLRRTPSSADRRRVELRLTAQGEKKIELLSASHLQELRQLGPELHRLGRKDHRILTFVPGTRRLWLRPMQPSLRFRFVLVILIVIVIVPEEEGRITITIKSTSTSQRATRASPLQLWSPEGVEGQPKSKPRNFSPQRGTK